MGVFWGFLQSSHCGFRQEESRRGRAETVFQMSWAIYCLLRSRFWKSPSLGASYRNVCPKNSAEGTCCSLSIKPIQCFWKLKRRNGLPTFSVLICNHDALLPLFLNLAKIHFMKQSQFCTFMPSLIRKSRSLSLQLILYSDCMVLIMW
jgi:hypothetical protein